jgi:hypothetical protein
MSSSIQLQCLLTTRWKKDPASFLEREEDLPTNENSDCGATNTNENNTNVATNTSDVIDSKQTDEPPTDELSKLSISDK